MSSRSWVVILSLVACSPSSTERVSPPADVAPSTPGTSDVIPSTPVDAKGSGSGVSGGAQGGSEAVARERRRLRLIEHRGPADAPLLYRVVEPDDARAETPVVIALHGRGDTSEGFSRLVRSLDLDARVVIPDAPLPFGLAGGRQWYDMSQPDVETQLGARLDTLESLIDWVARAYPRAGALGLMGFSQGAVLAIEAAIKRPARLAAVAALSGYVASSVGGAEGVTLPVLVTAGTKDDLVPQDRSWAAASRLEALGRRVRRLAFVGPHAIPPRVVEGVRAFFDEVLAREPGTNQ
jgi:phospholipase/carboxylesterase